MGKIKILLGVLIIGFLTNSVYAEQNKVKKSSFIPQFWASEDYQDTINIKYVGYENAHYAAQIFVSQNGNGSEVGPIIVTKGCGGGGRDYPEVSPGSSIVCILTPTNNIITFQAKNGSYNSTYPPSHGIYQVTQVY
ncbi:MAG TPA: hypothetical protein VHZ76_05615 [Gammaproteobacteria bacterium]|jgi:hypothetical protein|nr:hypothetical protein [Gammaproteobacteria bacterium]